MSSFPGAFVDVIAARLTARMTHDPLQANDWRVYPRPLRMNDPNFAVGVFDDDWQPLEGSMEIGGMLNPLEPTLARYILKIQNSYKNTDEAKARAQAGTNAKIVRAILYRDPVLAVQLRALSDDSIGVTERVKRTGVGRQKFTAANVKGTFYHLVVTDVWIEVEAQVTL